MINCLEGGGGLAADQLLPVLYEELRLLAKQKMSREAAGQTLQSTALVHEAWLRVGGGSRSWESRAHFFGAAAEAMRRILVDRARSKRALRHGGGQDRVNVDEVEIEAPASDGQLLEVHEILDQFAELHPQKAELVKLRYFAGLRIAEAAEVLGISVPTAKRHWVFARAWLFQKMMGRKDAIPDSGRAAEVL